MGSRSLACALVQHRQAEPRATLRRPWTFDRAGPQLLCMCCVRELPDSYIQGCVHCRASLSAYRAKQGARAGCAHDGHTRPRTRVAVALVRSGPLGEHGLRGVATREGLLLRLAWMDGEDADGDFGFALNRPRKTIACGAQCGYSSQRDGAARLPERARSPTPHTVHCTCGASSTRRVKPPAKYNKTAGQTCKNLDPERSDRTKRRDTASSNGGGSRGKPLDD